LSAGWEGAVSPVEFPERGAYSTGQVG